MGKEVGAVRDITSRFLVISALAVIGSLVASPLIGATLAGVAAKSFLEEEKKK